MFKCIVRNVVTHNVAMLHTYFTQFIRKGTLSCMTAQDILIYTFWFAVQMRMWCAAVLCDFVPYTVCNAQSVVVRWVV